MKDIEKYSDWIAEEIADAEKYAREALEKKDFCLEDAKMAYQNSLEEMVHMGRLHKAIVRMIDEYRTEHGEPPPAMMAIYEREHKKHIDSAAIVKALQAMFLEG